MCGCWFGMCEGVVGCDLTGVDLFDEVHEDAVSEAEVVTVVGTSEYVSLKVEG